MSEFYIVIREGATTSAAGIYKTIDDAKDAAKNHSSKHATNAPYIIMKSVFSIQACIQVVEKGIEL